MHTQAEEQRNVGNGHYQEGRYEEAYAAYTRAASINPRVPAYHANKCVVQCAVCVVCSECGVQCAGKCVL